MAVRGEFLVRMLGMCRFRMMRGGCEDFGDGKEDWRLKGIGDGVRSTSVDLEHFYSFKGEIASL
jgi:hypothetical protein